MNLPNNQINLHTTENHKETLLNKLAFYSICLYAFSIPLEGLIVFSAIGSFSRLAGLLALLTGIIALLERGRTKPFVAYHAYTFLFLLWVTMSAFWVPPIAFSDTQQKLFTLFQLVLISYIIIEGVSSQNRYDNLLRFYLLGAFISTFFIINTYLSERYLYINWRTARYELEWNAAGEQSIILAVGILIAGYFLSRKMQKRRLIYASYIPFSVFAILLTSSRSGFLAGMAAILISMGVLMFDKSKQTRTFFIAVAVIGGLAASLSFVPDTTWNRLSTMTTLTSNTNSLSGRGALWEYAFEQFQEHPIIGIGWGRFQSAVFNSSYYFTETPVHNTYLAVATELGLIGFGLFLAVLINIVKNIEHIKSSNRFILGGVLFAWSISATFISLETHKITWLIFSLIVTAYTLDKGNQTEFPI